MLIRIYCIYECFGYILILIVSTSECVISHGYNDMKGDIEVIRTIN
jgi:hypothetical protein